MRQGIGLLLLLASGLLAACGVPVNPMRQFQAGDKLATYDFSAPNTFEEGTYGAGAAQLQIRDGAYHIVVTGADSTIWYGQWGEAYDNVVVEVEAQPEAGAAQTVYGAACRLQGRTGEMAAEDANNGDGYLFLLDSAGRFAIMRAQEQNVLPLIDWKTSDKIHLGVGKNSLRAVCLKDYLALYINGQFAGDTFDPTYASGQVGLVAAAAQPGAIKTAFDNLKIFAAKAGS